MVNNSTFYIRLGFQLIRSLFCVVTAPVMHPLGYVVLLMLAATTPALAVTERFFPVLPGAVIELCRPGEDDTPCIESPNLRMRYSSTHPQHLVQRELLSASRRLGWRMYPLKGEPGRFQSANPKRSWDLLWELRPAPANDNGPGFHVYYWKITGQ